MPSSCPPSVHLQTLFCNYCFTCLDRTIGHHVTLEQKKLSWLSPSWPTAMLSLVWVCSVRTPKTAYVHPTCNSTGPLWNSVSSNAWKIGLLTLYRSQQENQLITNMDVERLQDSSLSSNYESIWQHGWFTASSIMIAAVVHQWLDTCQVCLYFIEQS